jgi:hypothetical protein
VWLFSAYAVSPLNTVWIIIEADRPSLAGGVLMHLAADYVHPTPRGGRCRVRIYLSEDELDAPVVICTELPDNPGTSITNSAEQIAAEVMRAYPMLEVPFVWIEHHPPQSTDRETETFDLVTFSGYEITERAPDLGEFRYTIGEPTWKRLDRPSVEALVGEPL